MSTSSPRVPGEGWSPASSSSSPGAAAGTHASARPSAASAGAQRARRRRVAVTVALLAATVAVYAPILYHMVLHWKASDDYSHGFLIVPLAAYFAWERRGALRRAPIRGSWLGLLPLLLGTFTLTVGRLGVELMNMRVSFVLTVIGLVLLLLGRRVLKVLAFPLLFLFLMVPLPQSLVNVVAFPLQLVAADSAVQALYYLQVPALREGNIIHLPGQSLFVAEACSGLRSLMALITLGVVFAYFFRTSWAERAILVASTIPIAIAANAFRVGVTGILAYQFGSDAAHGPLHQLQGFTTFGMAFLLLLAEASLLAWLWPQRWRSTGRTRRRARS